MRQSRRYAPCLAHQKRTLSRPCLKGAKGVKGAQYHFPCNGEYLAWIVVIFPDICATYRGTVTRSAVAAESSWDFDAQQTIAIVVRPVATIDLGNYFVFRYRAKP